MMNLICWMNCEFTAALRESVLADFQLWRLNKSSPHNRIPDDLKRKHLINPPSKTVTGFSVSYIG